MAYLIGIVFSVGDAGADDPPTHLVVVNVVAAKFAVDARRTPQRIRTRHLDDQPSQLGIQRWTPGAVAARAPSPSARGAIRDASG